MRRITAKLAIEPPAGSGGGPKSVELDLDLTLTGVNAEQHISAPSGAKPLSELFQKLGVNPIELAQGLSGKGGGLGGLLKGLSGAAGGVSQGGGSTGTTIVPQTGSASGQQAYLKCVQSAKTPVDLQKCAALLK